MTAIANQYKLLAIKIGNTVIGQLTDMSYSDEIQELLSRDSGSTFNRLSGVNLENVRIRATSEAIKTALGAVSLLGVNLAVSNAVAYFVEYAAGGGIKASSCKTLTISKGVAVLRSLSAGDGQLANVSIEVIAASSDGTTHPVVVSESVALPTCTTREMYVVGGTSGMQSLSIDFGVSEIVRRGDSDPYPTFVAIDLIQPKVTYSQIILPTTLGAITTLHSLTLRDVAAGGYRGTSPITISMSQSLGSPRSIGGNPTVAEFAITPTWNGTNAPITFTGL